MIPTQHSLSDKTGAQECLGINSQIQLKKINEFKNAMHKYNSKSIYSKIGVSISILVVSMQIASFILIFPQLRAESEFLIIGLFCLSYILADFAGGIAHMIMDNCVNYTSAFGPFVAAFHLHHKQPQYKNRNMFKVYFYESGSKAWLVIFLVILIGLQLFLRMPPILNIMLVFFGILSSVAEVSHYWCHNASHSNWLLRCLQKYGILLSKQHHQKHHLYDNVNYCFLNGIADPLVNKIAQYFYSGYKNNSDLHVASYIGPQTENR